MQLWGWSQILQNFYKCKVPGVSPETNQDLEAHKTRIPKARPGFRGLRTEPVSKRYFGGRYQLDSPIYFNTVNSHQRQKQPSKWFGGNQRIIRNLWFIQFMSVFLCLHRNSSSAESHKASDVLDSCYQGQTLI